MKKATAVDTSVFAKKDLVSLRSDVDDLDIATLETVQIDFSKLSNVVDNDVDKRTVYDELVKKVYTIHAIDVSKLVIILNIH